MPTLVCEQAEAVGGKAGVLRELEGAGFNVPAFEVNPQCVQDAVIKLGFPLTVRSSASVEDGDEASFAGQFESFLNLTTIEQVTEAIERCHESAREPSVIEYCRKNRIDPDDFQMNVIVQRMIEPQLAGVAFTVDPVTGAENIVIEACEGLADELLAGTRRALPAAHELVRRYTPIIEKTALAIQRHFGSPQDIEFAIEDGELFVLQARPITCIGFADNIGEWTNADFRDGGVSATVCSPLMWSLYDFIWEDTLKDFLRSIKLLKGDFEAGRMFFGRPYWNLGEVKKCMAKMPGFVEREFDNDLSVKIEYEGDGIRTPVNAWTILRSIPTLFAIDRFFKKQMAFDRQFLEGGFEELIAKYESTSFTDAEFKRLIKEDFFVTESNYFRTIYAASLAKQDFLSSFPDADYASLVAGLSNLQHMAPIRMMRDMAARGETDVEPIIERFGHHYSRGLDIINPRWADDRNIVEQQFASMRSSSNGNASAIYETARAGMVERLPKRKHKSFERKLDRLRTFLWLREEMRDLSGRMYHLIQQFAIRIAGRRGIGDNVFFMTFDEILDDDRSNIDASRAIFDGFRNFRAPNEIGGRFTFEKHTIGNGAMNGIGASSGSVRGLAHIAHNVEQAMCAEPGSILVCPFTDPGWTTVLDRVAGVVTETGGMLSHAAVICREYGIPAVLDVADATKRIKQGSTIIVHGGDGAVEVIE